MIYLGAASFAIGLQPRSMIPLRVLARKIVSARLYVREQALSIAGSSNVDVHGHSSTSKALRLTMRKGRSARCSYSIAVALASTALLIIHNEMCLDTQSAIAELVQLSFPVLSSVSRDFKTTGVTRKSRIGIPYITGKPREASATLLVLLTRRSPQELYLIVD